MESERGDARSISVLLKVRKKGPRPAVKSLQEIGLDGVCEFIYASLLELTLTLRSVKKTSRASVASVERVLSSPNLNVFGFRVVPWPSNLLTTSSM